MIRVLFRNNGIQTNQKIFPKTKIILHRFQSTETGGPKQGGFIKYILPITFGTVGAGAGIVGFASTDIETRKNIERTIPGSSYLIETILGPHEKKQQVPKSDDGLLKKKLDREKKKKDDLLLQETKSDKDLSAPDIPSTIISPPDYFVPSDDVQLKDPVPVIEKITPIETPEQKEPDEIVEVPVSQILEETIESAQKTITAALTAAEDAAAAVHEHANKIYVAIDTDQNNETLYEAAAKVGKVKKELIKSAEDQLKIATTEIERLQQQVESGKDNILGSDNKILPIAEVALAELQYAIKKINTTLDDALENSNAVNKYKDLMDASWNQFFEEIRAIIPDAKMTDSSVELTKDEMFLLLVHAHRKVSSLQKTLAKLETVEKDKIRDSILKAQEKQGTKLNDSRLQSELENQRREIGLEHRHRLTQLKEDMETELRTQLKRQAAAHTDHLADVVYAKEKELNRIWENKLADDLQMERDQYVKSVSLMKGEIMGVKDAIKSRAEIDKAAHAAHLLWMSCESLATALRIGKVDALSWEDKLQPLKERVDAIRKAVGDPDPFVEVVLNSIPGEALARGVYTEDALKERFLKVDNVCGKVSLVGDNGGSLLRYMLSYMQSFLLLNAFQQLPNGEIYDNEIDVELLKTHDILARTKCCLAKDDLLQAVKYINLLGGEPRNVASDWLKEAKLTLEAKQAADILMAYASATGANAL